MVINKIDLAPLVGASLEVMRRDTLRVRGDHPFIFTNLKNETGLAEIVAWIESQYTRPTPCLGGLWATW